MVQPLAESGGEGLWPHCWASILCLLGLTLTSLFLWVWFRPGQLRPGSILEGSHVCFLHVACFCLANDLLFFIVKCTS